MTDLAAQPKTVRPPRTLTRQLIAGDVDRALARVLSELSIAAKQLERDVARAALVGRLGLAGGANVSGDSQKKLDVYADDLTVGALAVTGLVAAVVSEEREHGAGPRRARRAVRGGHRPARRLVQHRRERRASARSSRSSRTAARSRRTSCSPAPRSWPPAT